ncbi:MAG: TlpA disulfide reductase family protein [Pseudomonadota bacterium]
MTRIRTLLAVIAVAAIAGGAGAGVAWLRIAPQPAPADATALFASTFDDADGRPQAIAQWKGRPLVVNFWATWCPPCVEEMPDLQRVRDEYRTRGAEIVGVGIDNAVKIREFRDRLGITLPLLVAGVGGTELARDLGNAAGVLPYTVLVAPDGKVVQRKIGQVKPAELRAWLDATLAAHAAGR